MRSTQLILTALLATAVAAPAAAQQFGPGFARIDTDQDGAVSRAEATEARRAMFNRLDRNADGRISSDEQEAARTRMAAFAQMVHSAMVLRSQRMDTDGDGSLTLDEFTAQNLMFELVDRDGDGFITKAEAAAMRDTIAQRHR